MFFPALKALSAAALLACASSVAHAAGSPEPLCSLPTASLVQAAQQYPTLTTAINEVLKNSIAIWYTDNEAASSLQSKLSQLLSHCSSSTRMTIVVYGLPNKDCEAGYSNLGFNKNANDYRNFIQTLANAVGQRKVLYELEPDAVGLVANGGCAVQNNYTANVRTALEVLSKNPNADIYLDVGYWTLQDAASTTKIANAVKQLSTVGRLKGITLNSDNFRPTADMVKSCTNFQNAYGSTKLNCVIDTSRNYNNNPPSTEWCNARFGGIGRLPTASTGYSNIDYFIWIKPAGESDGTCDGSDRSPDAMKGPVAGAFFKEGFISLWNNGIFVKERGFKPISG
jgi:cellulase/cellobiase CelA1